MNRRTLFLGFAVTAILIAAISLNVGMTNAQGTGITALSTGSGQITRGGELRTFSFTAQRDSSNNSSGQAELFNRASGVRIHMQLDCLNVAGNVATMSGKVTEANAAGSGFIGNPAWFRVVDNGEGAGAPPDLISLVAVFFGSPGVPCTDGTVTPANIPIEDGNIQVH